MTTEGLIGYETLIEHHKEHHKAEDALTAENATLKEKIKLSIDEITKLSKEHIALNAKLEQAKEALKSCHSIASESVDDGLIYNITDEVLRQL